MDILDRLKRWAALKSGDMPEFVGKWNWADDLNADLVDAIAEIARLRSLAGAVSDGQSLAEIKSIPQAVTTYAGAGRILPDDWRYAARAAHVDCDEIQWRSFPQAEDFGKSG